MMKGETMRTYQELIKFTSDESRAVFIQDAIEEFKGSKEYAEALAGERYYDKHNTTIENYQKVITTISGAKRNDPYSANYKLKTLFFRRLVMQQVQYVLGNGITLNEPENKEKLGKDFDFQLSNCAKRAMAAGVGFGFWNVDHLEVFGYCETPKRAGFCPFYDTFTGMLRAGARFWTRHVDDDEILRFTLYEEDGFTEYSIKDDDVTVLKAKTSYIKRITTLQNGEIEDTHDENYSVLPIIPLFANDSHESELVGIRESIDCYDFIKSGLANNIDDSSEIFWLLKNTGGMDDVDIAQFLQRLKTVHAAAVDGDAGVDIKAETIPIPTEARTKMLEILRKDIYEDFQALDVNTLSAAQKTTQEIQAAYQAQDNKCADFEYYILDFVQKILQLAEIDDNPVLNWNRVVNQAEQTQMVMSASSLIPQELVIKHLPFLTPEEADEAIEQMNIQDMEQFEDEEEDADNSDIEEINALLDQILEGLGDE